MVTYKQSRSSSLSLGIAVVIVSGAGAFADPVADTPTPPEITKYCTNIAAAASDARFSWQTGKLAELEVRIKTRIQDLDAKQAELRGWIDKRDAMIKQANEKLVGIYAKMRPEAAAAQISTLDDDMAATVLSQLPQRPASAIFNELSADRASKLAALIAAGPASDKSDKSTAGKPAGEQSAANDRASAGNKQQ